MLGDFERSCGFICSKLDMKNWNPLEVCQLLYTTKDLYGELKAFVPEWTIEDEVNYCKMSLNNLYHALCHSYIHGERDRLASNLLFHYKSVYFILQNTYYLETALFLIGGGQVEFEKHFGLLFDWCQKKMEAL